MAKAELGGVEVKKKRYLVMTVAAVLIMAAVAASAYVLQKNPISLNTSTQIGAATWLP